MGEPPETRTQAGDVLEHYRLLDRIGVGGMGVVYKGEDLRLGRPVAIKLLPGEIARDPAALARFRREAQVASALNHPGICTIHDVGETGGVAYLVMEHLEGAPLNELIARGPQPPAQVIGIGRDIADALEAAHGAGILHRDVKPANIFVTARGQAKLLDFGIARRAGDGQSDAQTATSLTALGATPGTPAYMSPEQLRGGGVDARSDIFSLGAVLYEMATGKRPLGGSPRLPLTPALDRIVGKALEEDPTRRYQTAADLRADLARLDRGGTGLSRRAWAAIAAAAAVVVALAGAAYWQSRPVVRPFDQFAIAQVSNTGGAVAAAISPDGRFIASVQSADGMQSVWLRNVSTGSDTEIAAARPVVYASLAFSPDGDHIYFRRADGQTTNLLNLYQQPVLGGEAKLLVHDIDSNVSFSPAGDRIAYARANFPENGQMSILIADADGKGEQSLLSRPISGGYTSPPAWSPDGTLIAFADRGGDQLMGSLRLVDVQSGEQRALFSSDDLQVSAPVWSQDGRTLFVLHAARRTGLQQRQIGAIEYPSGRFRPITNDTNDYTDLQLAAASRSLVTVQRRIQNQVEIHDAADLRAAGTTLLSVREAILSLRWRPNGELTYSMGNRILARRTDGSERVLLSTDANTPPAQFDICGASGDLVFVWLFHGGGAPRQLWRVDAAGGGQTALVTKGAVFAPTCSPDGLSVTYAALPGGVWRVPTAGGQTELASKGVPVSNTLYLEGGQSFAYVGLVQTASGRQRKLVLKTPGREERLLPISNDFAGGLRAAPSAAAVSYLARADANQQLWVQPLDGSAARLHGTLGGTNTLSFDWSPDGRHIVVLREARDADVILLTDKGGS